MENQTTSADRKVASFASFFEPVRKSITVGCSPERAFSLFTDGFTRWWPLATHSLSQARAIGCGIDPAVGGEVYEIRDDGERIAWGWVLEWEPPRRFVMAWHPGATPEQAQEVELRFTGVVEGSSANRLPLRARATMQGGKRCSCNSSRAPAQRTDPDPTERGDGGHGPGLKHGDTEARRP